MKKITILTFIVFIIVAGNSSAQSYYQYFDGKDTSKYNSILIRLDTAKQNVWQIGRPHKHYFDSAFSRPKVLVTDTSLPYPIKNTSRFSFKIPELSFSRSMLVLQWIQKIDMDSARDGGYLEYSCDKGKTWTNGFSSKYVYNFYGFNAANKMILANGDTAFSGTDSTWRDVWFCLNLNALPPVDTLQFRFTFLSDSINHNREGWMIDNMNAHINTLHPVNEVKNDPYFTVYPRLTTGTIYIKLKPENNSKIQEAQLYDESGRLVASYKIGPGDSYINIGDHATGWYNLRINTNTISKIYSLWLNKN